MSSTGAPVTRQPPQKRAPLVIRWPAIWALAVAVAVGAVSGVYPLLGLLVGIAIIALVTIRKRPDSVAVLAIAVIYSNAVVILAQRGTVPTTAGALLIAALVVPLGRRVLVDRELPTAPPSMSVAAVFAAVLCASSLTALVPAVAISSAVASLTQGILLYALAAMAVVETWSIGRVADALIIVGAGLGLLSVIQHVTGDYSNTFFGFAGVSDAAVHGSTTAAVDLQPRLNGNIGETNRYGQVLGVLLPLVAARAVSVRPLVIRVLYSIAGALIGGGIVFTYSRGTAVALVAALVTVTAMRWVKVRWLLLAVVAAMVVAVSTPGYADRLSSLTGITGATALEGSNNAADNAVRGRTTEVLSALLAYADHPVLGVGPGVFPLVYPQYAAQVGIRPRLEEREAHNLFAGIAAETGTVGLVTFVLLLLRVLTALAEAARRWAGLDRTRMMMARGFFGAVLVYCYSGMFLHLSYVRYFWLLIGLAAATARLPGAQVRALPGWFPRLGRRSPGLHVPAAGG